MIPNTEFILFDPTIMDNLNHLPEMCIFGLVNEDNKVIFIYRTTNIVTALSRIVKEYKYRNKNILKLPLVIIETITDKNNLWVRYNYWDKYYSNAGYIVANKCKYNIQYKLRKQIMGDFRRKYDRVPLFYVKLISRRYKEVVVGVFDNNDETEAFINKHYSNGIDNIVYSNNSLTREYCETIKS